MYLGDIKLYFLFWINEDKIIKKVVVLFGFRVYLIVCVGFFFKFYVMKYYG